MRLLAIALVVASAPAFADPKDGDSLVIPFKDGPVKLDPKSPAESWLVPPAPLGKTPATGAPSFGGGWSFGHVIVPPAHPDMAAPPRGMVFEPVDVGDPIAIEPGTSQLGPGWKPRSYTGKLAQGLADGLTKAFQLVVPKHL